MHERSVPANSNTESKKNVPSEPSGPSVAPLRSKSRRAPEDVCPTTT